MREEEQLASIKEMSNETVLLSESTRKVVLALLETNVALAIGPPRRLVLDGFSY